MDIYNQIITVKSSKEKEKNNNLKEKSNNQNNIEDNTNNNNISDLEPRK